MIELNKLFPFFWKKRVMEYNGLHLFYIHISLFILYQDSFSAFCQIYDIKVVIYRLGESIHQEKKKPKFWLIMSSFIWLIQTASKTAVTLEKYAGGSGAKASKAATRMGKIVYPTARQAQRAELLDNFWLTPVFCKEIFSLWFSDLGCSSRTTDG